MGDVMSILSANYKAVGLAVPSKTAYVAVDPKLYQGSWTGKYANNKTFTIKVSNVTGFRAKVHYQSGTTSKYQDVLIKDRSFRVGDTKFALTNKTGQALIANVVTDPATGSTYLDKAYATQSS
jgi:hypothetical protein